jgi:hypothetical protein
MAQECPMIRTDSQHVRIQSFAIEDSDETVAAIRDDLNLDDDVSIGECGSSHSSVRAVCSPRALAIIKTLGRRRRMRSFH